MLRTLLEILTSGEENLTKSSLCRELNISPARLDNMLMVLAQKGKIRLMQNGESELCKDQDSCPTTGKACPGPAYCALLMEMPLAVEVNIKD